VRKETILILRRIKRERSRGDVRRVFHLLLLQGKEQEIYSLNVPGQCPVIIQEGIDSNQYRALADEEGRVRESGQFGIYSKRLFDHLGIYSKRLFDHLD
jgi:hypothetical protein